MAVTRKREPRRETSPPPWEWGGEHYAVSADGEVLQLWSVVRTEESASAMHRASIRVNRNGVAMVTLDSPALKPIHRRWRKLTARLLLTFPHDHKTALRDWLPQGVTS